jgi:hypothetical protein
MRRTLTCLALTLGVALAACSPPAAKKEDGGTGAAPAPAASTVKPGQWRTTLTFTDMTAPGLPAAVVAKMKADPVVDVSCNTSEDVADFANKSLADDEDAGKNCTVNRMNNAGGRIDGESSCTMPGGTTMTMRMAGTYSADRVDMTMDMNGQTPAGPMSQKMQMVAERLGDCPG